MDRVLCLGGQHSDGILVAAEGRGGCIFYTIYTGSIWTSQRTQCSSIRKNYMETSVAYGRNYTTHAVHRNPELSVLNVAVRRVMHGSNA